MISAVEAIQGAMTHSNKTTCAEVKARRSRRWRRHASQSRRPERLRGAAPFGSAASEQRRLRISMNAKRAF